MQAEVSLESDVNLERQDLEPQDLGQLDVARARLGFLRRWLGRAAPAEQPRRQEAVVVAFASGKGGTGKSFLATNLAIGLHERGLRVAVVDCDFGLANAHP